MAEYIKRQDDLNTGRIKINEELTKSNNNAEKAKIDSSEALNIANQSIHQSQSTQDQLNQVIIDGDSSVEAAAARVDEDNITHTTLKERIDDGFTKTKTQLAETVNYTDLAMSILATGKKRKIPIVSIVSDDGSVADLTKMHPLLEGKGIRAGLGIITSRVGTSGYMTWEQIKEMSDLGYEIMSHSHTHANLRELTEEEMDVEVSTGYNILREKGYNPTGFIYPYNADNEQTHKVVGRYFISGYTKRELREQGRNWYNMNNQAIRRVAVGSYFDQPNEWDGDPDTSSLEYYKWRVDEAIENNNWLVLVIHPGPTDAQQMQYLEDLIDYIQSKNVPILKPTEAFRIYGNLIDVRTDENELIVDNQGVPISGFSDLIVEKEVNKYDNTDKIGSFPKNKVIISYVTSPSATGFPSNRAGTLITFNVGQTGFENQLYIWHDSEVVFIRRLNAYEPNQGDWGEWFELGGTFERYLGNYTAESLPNDFPTFKSFSFYVDTLRGSGTPNNEPGIINVYKATNEPRYVKQDFRPYNKNEMWIRSGTSGNGWTSWKQLS